MLWIGDLNTTSISRDFVELFKKECKVRTIDLGECVGVWGCPADEKGIELKISEAKDAECDFILFGHRDNEKYLHGMFYRFIPTY